MEQVSDRCPALGKSIFRRMEAEHYERVCAARTVQLFAPGAVICNEGSAPFAVYCIQAGTVKMTRTGERGDLQILRLRGPSDVFGLRPILAGDTFTVDAVALVECTVCLVPRHLVLDLLDESRIFARAVMEYVAREMKVTEDVLMALTRRPVRRRVADILLLLHGHTIDGDDWEPFPLTHLKRKEIAQLVSTTPETLSRVLSEFAELGFILLTRKDLKILKPEALQEVDS